MFKRLIASITVFMFVSALLMPSVAFAQDSTSAKVNAAKIKTAQCECWCGLKVRGAKSYADMNGASACALKCKEKNEKFLACSVPGDGSSPHTNTKCWDNAACIESDGYVSKETPAECMPNFVHCFPNDRPIKLALSIGDVDEVMGIGGYIKVIYQWLLGSAVVFATVMIIVGGIQYMIAGGSPAGVKQARERIFNALIGLVILFGAYTILATVNPQLLSLRMPALPKVKPIFTPGAVNTCESYEAANYTVKVGSSIFHTGGHECGKKGTITKGPSGETSSGDEECYYTACSKKGTICRINAEEEKGACHTCNEIYSEEANSYNSQSFPIKGFYPNPSGSVCGGAGVSSGVGECKFMPKSLYLGILGFSWDRCLEFQFDCGSVSSCESYNNIKMPVPSATSTEIKNIVDNGAYTALENVFDEFCRDDICEISSTGCQLQQTTSTQIGLTCTSK